MTTYTQDLIRIANNIDMHGIAANETAVALVAELGRRATINSALLSVLSDATQPEIARARAFGRIATTLAATDPANSDAQPREHRQHPPMVVA